MLFVVYGILMSRVQRDSERPGHQGALPAAAAAPAGAPSRPTSCAARRTSPPSGRWSSVRGRRRRSTARTCGHRRRRSPRSLGRGSRGQGDRLAACRAGDPVLGKLDPGDPPPRPRLGRTHGGRRRACAAGGAAALWRQHPGGCVRRVPPRRREGVRRGPADRRSGGRGARARSRRSGRRRRLVAARPGRGGERAATASARPAQGGRSRRTPSGCWRRWTTCTTPLVTVDYPDAITNGLRRSVDALRAVLERTRGDVTTTVLQAGLRDAIDGPPAGPPGLTARPLSWVPRSGV